RHRRTAHYSLFLYAVTAPSELYTLSLHDALPIFVDHRPGFRGGSGESLFDAAAERPPRACGESDRGSHLPFGVVGGGERDIGGVDRKSTRLNSSHVKISYAVFCLKKKKTSSTLRS